jgi:putative FmdB family regulatory protein
MPTYDYECTACGHTFELFQSITAEPEKKCPSCKKLKLRRLIGTGAAVVFKGSGFYQTDYRSDSYKQSAAAESKTSSSDSKAESTKTGEAKSADTSASTPAPKSESTASDAKPKSKGKGKKGD